MILDRDLHKDPEAAVGLNGFFNISSAVKFAVLKYDSKKIKSKKPLSKLAVTMIIYGEQNISFGLYILLKLVSVIFRSNLTSPENLVFTDLQWFNFTPCCSDVQVYFQNPVTSLLGVVGGETGNKTQLLRLDYLKNAISLRLRRNVYFPVDTGRLSVHDSVPSEIQLQITITED